MEYEATPIKAPKAKAVKTTAKHQAVKASAQLATYTLIWLLTKRIVAGLWRNKVPITVNAFIFENGYMIVHHFHLLAK